MASTAALLAAGATGPVTRADAAPATPAATATGAPVTGIPTPCPAQHPYPDGATPAQVAAQLSRTFGIRLAGAGFTTTGDQQLVKVVWQTLDGISCTGFLHDITAAHPGFTLNAARISGWAWGDWGLTRTNAVTVDFTKWHTAWAAGDKGRLVRLLVHELAHAWSQSPAGSPTYQRFLALAPKHGALTPYGSRNANENFSEVVGYYVGRCANNNPYDRRHGNTGRFDAYYALVRQQVFDGHDFGPAVGTTPDCSLHSAVALPRSAKEGLEALPD